MYTIDITKYFTAAKSTLHHRTQSAQKSSRFARQFRRKSRSGAQPILLFFVQ
jgi:hypothetical protein